MIKRLSSLEGTIFLGSRHHVPGSAGRCISGRDNDLQPSKIAKHPLNFVPRHIYTPLEEKLVSVLQSCKTLKHLKQIQTQLTTLGLIPHQGTATYHLFCRCLETKQILHAHQLFDQILNPNIDFYNLMLKGYLHVNVNDKVIALFGDMTRSGVRPSCYTVPMVLKSCVKLSALKEGEEVHCLVIKIGFNSNSYVGTTLIDLYSGAGLVKSAYRVFSEMVLRNVVAWTLMIKAYIANDDLLSARRLFDLAPERDVVMWNSMVSGYIESREMEEARKLFDSMPNKDLMSWNTVLNGYAKNGDIEECERLFEQMTERNIFSWNGLIGGYSHNGRFGQVVETFRRMLNESNVQPNDATLVNVLSACAKLGALDLGKWVHMYAKSNGYEANVYVGNGLIDMYAKCGMIESAIEVFRKLDRKDLISWNTIINGLAVHGHGADALSLFDEMVFSGQKPDGITFLGIFCACSHLGLVKEGFSYFDMMMKEFSVPPQIEHYGCMVDLLGRAGLLEQAVNFVRKMPMKADSVIWTTLLGACRIYKNIEFAELALHKLIELEPQNPANYVMLANIYGDARKWGDVARLKVAMRDTRSKKLPGCSLIEVDDKVVEFYCYDERHSETDEIYDVLRQLMKLLQLSGYFSDIMELEE